MRNYQHLITEYKRIKSCMSFKDRKSAQFIIDSYMQNIADMADIEVLAKYKDYSNFMDTRDLFILAVENYNLTLRKLN